MKILPNKFLSTFFIIIFITALLKAQAEYVKHVEVAKYAVEASTRPIAYSIVREDSAQDLDIIKRYYPEEKVSMLMIASGGCTAAQLVAQAPLNELMLVDPNIAQLELSKFKIQMLNLPMKKRLEILGYLPLDQKERKDIMCGYMHALEINPDIFGDIDIIAYKGLDSEGRYEKVFEELRNELASYKKDIEYLFFINNINEQREYISSNTELGRELDMALEKVMSQENLVKIFGEKATANRAQEFSRHFAQRIRVYLSNNLASSSPWLANMLLGRFHEEIMFPWLSANCSQITPKINYYHGCMINALEQSKPESYHVIHLSNIIDWSSSQEAEKTLKLAYKVLKPGGVVIIRQLNSDISISELNQNFKWNLETSQELLRKDRSFVYKNFFIGFKPKSSVAPRVKSCIDDILTEMPVNAVPFFKDLHQMDKEIFKGVQAQLYFAINSMPKSMAALVSRLPLKKDKLDTIYNVLQDIVKDPIKTVGVTNTSNTSHNKLNRHNLTTFRNFLNSLNISSNYIDKLDTCSAVTCFNYTLMRLCSNESLLSAVACNAMIAYLLSDMTILTENQIIELGWIKKEDLVYYNGNQNSIKQHIEELCKILEPYMDNPVKKRKVVEGLQLGSYMLNHLYNDLYQMAKVQKIKS